MDHSGLIHIKNYNKNISNLQDYERLDQIFEGTTIQSRKSIQFRLKKKAISLDKKPIFTKLNDEIIHKIELNNHNIQIKPIKCKR